MKIILVSITSILILFVSLLTIKFWGQGQFYTEYKHVLLQEQPSYDPLIFIKPDYANLDEVIKADRNLMLDISVTFDQKLVLPKRKWSREEKPVKLRTYDEIKSDVLLLMDYKQFLIKKKIIFNLIENAPAIHETFIFEMKKMALDKGENFIVTSPFEAPLKALKEIAPALLYGSTQPEILKIVAMQAMYLIEAANIRADVIIHPLKIRNQNFFNEEILVEMQKRHKKIIVGPVRAEDLAEAQQLRPFGIIVTR